MLEGEEVCAARCLRRSLALELGCGPSPETESNAEVFGAAVSLWGPIVASGGTTLIPPRH